MVNELKILHMCYRAELFTPDYTEDTYCMHKLNFNL